MRHRNRQDKFRLRKLREEVRRMVGATAGHPLPRYTSLGSYTILYVTKRGETLCAKCAEADTQEDDPVVGGQVFWEGPSEFCVNCNVEIESSYGDPDNPDDPADGSRGGR